MLKSNTVLNANAAFKSNKTRKQFPLFMTSKGGFALLITAAMLSFSTLLAAQSATFSLAVSAPVSSAVYIQTYDPPKGQTTDPSVPVIGGAACIYQQIMEIGLFRSILSTHLLQHAYSVKAGDKISLELHGLPEGFLPTFDIELLEGSKVVAHIAAADFVSKKSGFFDLSSQIPVGATIDNMRIIGHDAVKAGADKSLVDVRLVVAH